MTQRRLAPSCMRPKARLISLRGRVCVMYSSILTSPRMYLSTSLGTSVRDLKPPKAVPFQTRPVTSWKGRVAISLPAPATPMIVLTPQPMWHASSAARMTSTLPVQSKVKSRPPWVMATRCCWIVVPGPPSASGLTQSVAPNWRARSNLPSSTSTATIRVAPARAASSMTARPTVPTPKTATDEPGSTRAVLATAPHPVASPQPSRLILSSGASRDTLATDSACSTVYCANVLVPMYEYSGAPSLTAVNLVPPSARMTPLPEYGRILPQRFVLPTR
mmetsp:Transcript_7868/g.32513  ORF Transcript_7868/g.32513 Transcript_7868/m.32513 type:complete len:276 (-) Transcript_7868:548-1375(-)